MPEDLCKYYDKSLTLATEDRCLFYGERDEERLVTPTIQKSRAFELLHHGHIRIIINKNLYVVPRNTLILKSMSRFMKHVAQIKISRKLFIHHDRFLKSSLEEYISTF